MFSASDWLVAGRGARRSPPVAAATGGSRRPPRLHERSISASNPFLRQCLDPFIYNREQVFGFKNSAKYNISVYLYDSDLQHLAPFYRFVDDRISRSDRCWKPGNGHIGICFSQNRVIVSSDVSESPLISDSMTETDMSNYQSMASVPILTHYPSGKQNGSSNSETTEQRGVFIVTSSEKNQLAGERHEVTLGIISRLLSTFFDYADLLNDRH